MQIVIPMSGYGERFRRAGYEVPKPLIEVEGKPIIAHVIDMFPGNYEFIFICNQDHLDNIDYRMSEILSEFCKSPIIIGIKPHKLGPVHAVMSIKDILNDGPVIVNYCDFTCFWDFKNFLRFVEESKCDGAIPAYKGFHPHTLGTTNYAYMTEENGWVTDIQEKKPFTANRMQEFASSGTYYFSSATIMIDAFDYVVNNNINVGGEYYVSLAYKKLLETSDSVAVYELQHFMQWGTPEDVLEYKMWSNTFKNLCSYPIADLPALGTVVIPMAGMGQRFIDEGYAAIKPLISVSGLPMVMQAIADLPLSVNQVFVLRKHMEGSRELEKKLMSTFPNAVIELIDEVTEGQACTAKLGMDALKALCPLDGYGPFTFGACDNGAIYDSEKLYQLMNDQSVDVIVWGVRGHPNAIRNPNMFGWIEVNDSNQIKSISVKSPLLDPSIDPIVLGTFCFRNEKSFYRCFDSLVKRQGTVNGEYYLDSMINDAVRLGLNCKLFEVDSYLGWGTPNDLRTFEYWQSCFSKWSTHPYSLEDDSRITDSNREQLSAKYSKTVPNLPKPSL